MSLCDRYEEGGKDVWAEEPPLTPKGREAAQEALMVRWLNMEPSQRNRRLDLQRARQGVAIPDVPTFPPGRAQTFTVDDVTHTVRQWAAISGWSETTVVERLRNGQALGTKPGHELVTP